MNTKELYLIHASTSLSDLTGSGDELLIDRVDGTILARFWNGNFVCNSSSLTATEGQQNIETVKAA